MVFHGFQDRITQEADRMIETRCTIRDIADWSGIPKSTVHLDLTVRLEKIDKERQQKVREILDINFDDRQRRGGVATSSGWKEDPASMQMKVDMHSRVKVKIPVAEA